MLGLYMTRETRQDIDYHWYNEEPILRPLIPLCFLEKSTRGLSAFVQCRNETVSLGLSNLPTDRQDEVGRRIRSYVILQSETSEEATILFHLMRNLLATDLTALESSKNVDSDLLPGRLAELVEKTCYEAKPPDFRAFSEELPKLFADVPDEAVSFEPSSCPKTIDNMRKISSQLKDIKDDVFVYLAKIISPEQLCEELAESKINRVYLLWDGANSITTWSKYEEQRKSSKACFGKKIGKAISHGVRKVLKKIRSQDRDQNNDR